MHAKIKRSVQHTDILYGIKKILLDKFEIAHSTVEIEYDKCAYKQEVQLPCVLISYRKYKKKKQNKKRETQYWIHPMLAQISLQRSEFLTTDEIPGSIPGSNTGIFS
jgi:hypothetical protein